MGWGKVQTVNTNYSFRKFGYKVKREGGSCWEIYNLQISISGSRFVVPTVRYTNELLSQTWPNDLFNTETWKSFLTLLPNLF